MELLTDIFGIQVRYEHWDKQNALPLYMTGSYKFQMAELDAYRCIILTPTEELTTLPALKKQIKKIQELDNVPVVLRLPAVSAYRKKSLIESRIPFITNKQVYLPFMATLLIKGNEERKEMKKFMFSTQQLVLLYLYSEKQRLYVSDAAKQLPFTSMSVSRAVKQLEMTDLFDITKNGVNKVIESKYDRKELFERARVYLTTPVRTVRYLEYTDITEDMVVAGETVLAAETMLNPGRVATYAVYMKLIDKNVLMKELVDPNKQVRLELWEYNPKQFTGGNRADKLSVALSFAGTEDERIEEAVEELVESVW